MWYGVLGELAVRDRDGHDVHVSGPARRRLLSALIARVGESVPTATLVNDLWGDLEPPSAVTTLRSHVLRLRRDLNGSDGSNHAVVTEPIGYRLSCSRTATDAGQFELGVAAAEEALANGDPTGALASVDGALARWRGDAYVEFLDAEFAAVERVRLAERRAFARELRFDALLQLGQAATVVPEIEARLLVEPYRERLWEQVMLALYRAGRQAEALAAFRRARDRLSDDLGVDPGAGLRSLQQRILAHDVSLLAPESGAALSVAGAQEPECPYQGLARYEAADEAKFVGRERATGRLIARLGEAALLVVTGASGAGKSSLVRAGLIPALRSGALPGSSAWAVQLVAPPALKREAPAGDLVIVDQAEELFTTLRPDERATAATRIAAALDGGARVVLVIRADYYGRLAELPALAGRVGAATELLGLPSEAELERIVVEPARRAGIGVDLELVEQAVADVRDQPGALPLLSAALARTWDTREGGALSRAGYLSAGGVRYAVEETAERAYRLLTSEQQSAARRLLTRLAEHDAGTWIRRRLPTAEVTRIVDEHTLDVLSTHRIVLIDQRSVELTHEALLTAWPRLSGWLVDRAAGSALLEHLDTAVHGWESAGRSTADLYRGLRLENALAWCDEHPEDLSPPEQDFLRASLAASETDLEAERRRADVAVQGRRRLRMVAACLGLAVVVAAAALVAAVRDRRAADRAALLADARRLAALSLTAPDLRTSLLLAAASYELSPSNDARGALLSALERSGTARWRISTAGRDLFLGVDPTGSYAWTMDEARIIWRYSATTRQPVASFPARADAVSALSPDGRQLVVAGRSNYFDAEGDGRISVLNAGNGDTVTVLPVHAAAGDQVASQPAVYSRDGRWLAVVAGAAATTPDGREPAAAATVDVFATADYHAAPRQLHLTGPVRAVAASRDQLAVLTAAGTLDVVRLSDLAVTAHTRRAELAAPDPTATPAAFVMSPDGRSLLVTTAGDPTQPQLYDTGRLAASPRPLGRVDGGVRAAAFSPTSTLLAISSTDGSVTVVRTVDSSVVSRPLGAAPGQATSLAWSGTATADTGLFAAGRDQQLISLDVSTGLRLLGESGPGTPDADEVFRSGAHIVSLGPQVQADGQGRLPVRVTDVDGHLLAATALAMPGSDTLQYLSVDAAADRVLMITQDPGAVMRSSVFALPSGRLLSRFTTTGIPSTHNNDVGVIAPDGRTAVFAVADHTLAVFSLPDGNQLRRFDVGFSAAADDQHIVSPVSFAPDGRLVVYGQDVGPPDQTPPGQPAPAGAPRQVTPGNSLVGVVDLSDGRLEGQIGGFGELGLVDAVAWSPDGSRLAIGTLGGAVQVVSARDLSPVSPVVAAVSGPVQSVSFSPDGRTVVTGGSDGRLAMWDATTLQPIGPRLRAFRDDDSWWAWFRPDGTITGYAPAPQDGSERWFSFPTAPTAWIAAACRIAGSPLTRAEWSQFVGSTHDYRKAC